MEKLKYVLKEDFPAEESPRYEQFERDNCAALYMILSTLSVSETRLFLTINSTKEL